MTKGKTNFFSKYYEDISIKLSELDYKDLIKISDLLIKVRNHNKKVILLGNGASASISSHVSVDLTKVANIKSINFNEANLITCFANDFGHENWMSKAVEFYSEKGDLLICVSSSGNSKNVVNAAKKAKKIKLNVVTLTGFSFNNPLKKTGSINLWVNSNKYNIIENTHQTWLLSIVDYIVTKKL